MTFWFGVSFFFLAGEDSPENPMPLLLFFVVKGAALGSLYLWGIVFKAMCDMKALPSFLTDMPEESNDDFEEEEKED